MNLDSAFAANSIVWPITAFAMFLVVLRMFEKRTGPILDSIIGGVAKNAGSNAVFYAVAIMFGLSASLSAFIEVFQQLDEQAWKMMTWHQYATLWAKVLNPFIVAILAYTRNSDKDRKPGATNPPFSSPTQ